MARFFGNADLTLIEFLMDVSARSEVAEYCQAYMGDKPGVCIVCTVYGSTGECQVWTSLRPSHLPSHLLSAPLRALTFVDELLKRNDAELALPHPTTLFIVAKSSLSQGPSWRSLLCNSSSLFPPHPLLHATFLLLVPLYPLVVMLGCCFGSKAY